MSKRDIIMIAITVVLVGVMVGGFIYDRTPALLDRTNPYQFSQDDNIKVIATEKKGLTYRRVYYEAKLQILDGYWEPYFSMLATGSGNPGEMMNKEEYEKYEQSALANAALKPVPKDDAVIWLCGLSYDTHSLIYIITTENDGKAYIYVYYNRK